MARQRSSAPKSGNRSGSRSYSAPAREGAKSVSKPAKAADRAAAASGAKAATPQRRSGPRRDWSKIALYTFSVIIVLSMVLALFAPFLQG